jgi:hypothetical protein
MQEAIKVRVNMAMRADDPDWKGASCGGIWFPAGEQTEAILESDPGATGVMQVDEATHDIKRIFTVDQKLAALYILEGRRRDERGKWSEPGFQIVTEQGNPRNPKPPPRAPRLCRVEIIDRRDKDGVWESEKKAAAELAPGQNKAAAEQPRK